MNFATVLLSASLAWVSSDESATRKRVGERRAYLHEMRSLAHDGEGREILIGLAFEETEWYLRSLDRERDCAPRSFEQDEADAERYQALHEKHEKARLSLLVAEAEAEAEAEARQNPVKH